MLSVRAANLVLRCVLTAVITLWALHVALGEGNWRQMRELVALEGGARVEAQRLLSERRQVSAIAVSNAAQVRCTLLPWQTPAGPLRTAQTLRPTRPWGLPSADRAL
jgi:hypothetical protein